MSSLQPLVLLVGPTASGKSALGLQLARHFHGAILNCDSVQSYQRLDIGTAKPTTSEREVAPHFLFDHVAPGSVLTAGDFRAAALQVLQHELPRRPVFGVGGSGFYIQALEKGMFDIGKPDKAIDRRLRDQLAEKGLPYLWKKLQQLDPAYAERLNANDTYRILRALVIIEDSGKSVTSLRAEFRTTPFPFPLLKLGLAPDRSLLLPRVEARTQRMLQEGLLEEVRALLAEGYATWPPLQSVGYKECCAVLSGELSEEKLAAAIVEKTLQLAKRQKTWFKRDSEIQWLPLENPWPAAQGIVARFLDSLR